MFLHGLDSFPNVTQPQSIIFFSNLTKFPYCFVYTCFQAQGDSFGHKFRIEGNTQPWAAEKERKHKGCHTLPSKALFTPNNGLFNAPLVVNESVHMHV